jgi:precorrin-3B C17-methyltransferase
LEIKVIPGLSAMQAAASRVGAPLGHDFCVLSLSDRLKPWEAIATRLHAVGSADFALAIYNPVSSERTWQLAEARSIIAAYRTPDTPVVLARAVGRPGECIRITDLGSLDPAMVDMQTVVLVGSSTTRSMGMSDGRKVVYTPRSYGGSR